LTGRDADVPPAIASRWTPGAFVDGALSVFRGVAFIARTRRTWLPSTVPALMLVSLTCAGLYAAIAVVSPWVVAHVPLPGSALGRISAAVLRVLVAVFTAAASVFVAATFAPVLSAPALSRIIELREQALGLPPRERVSFLTEIVCGFSAQLFAYAVGVPVLAALWIVSLLFPPATVVTFPLKVAVTAWLLAWMLLDYPLSTRGVPLRARLTFLREQFPRVLGFAAAVLALFAVPLGAIVLLPAAVAAATEIGATVPCRAPKQHRVTSRTRNLTS
jgi:CysZ protein